MATRTRASTKRKIADTRRGVDLNNNLLISDLNDMAITRLEVGTLVAASGATGLVISSDEGGATINILDLISNSATPAAVDASRIRWYFDDDAGTSVEAGRLDCVVNSVVAGSVDSSFEFSGLVNGTMTLLLDIDSTAAGAVTSTFPVGDINISAGFLRVANAADANSFRITNNTATTLNVNQFTGSGVFTGVGANAYTSIVQSGLTSGDAVSIITNGQTTGTNLLLSSSGVLVTTGAMLEVVANGATTAAGVIRLSANGLTSGIGQLISHTTSVISDGGSLLSLTSTGIDTAATTGALLNLSSTVQAVGTSMLVASNGITTGTVAEFSST